MDDKVNVNFDTYISHVTNNVIQSKLFMFIYLVSCKIGLTDVVTTLWPVAMATHTTKWNSAICLHK